MIACFLIVTLSAAFSQPIPAAKNQEPIYLAAAKDKAENKGSLYKRLERSPSQAEPAPLVPERTKPVRPPKEEKKHRETGEGVQSAWAAGLNEYFGSKFTVPTTDEVLSQLATHLNRQTLYGVHPEDEFEKFEAALKTIRKNVPKNNLEIALVEGMYRNLTEWVRLEALYTVKPERSIVRDLIEVINNEAKLDPDFAAERHQQIVETVQSSGLFVPAGILFGVSVLPWRPMKVPLGYGIFEITAKPEFKDSSHKTEATFDTLQPPGPIARVDFDTIMTTSLRMENADAPDDFSFVQEWKGDAQQGLRGPAIPQKSFQSRLVRLTAVSPNESAVLRNVRLFAFKEPPAAVCAPTKTVPELDASFKEAAWPRQAQVEGFVNTDSNAFAEAQTNVRLCYTRDTLYLGVYAREPRMSTMVATKTERDANLSDEESFAVVLGTKSGLHFRFVVNPLGAQFDSRDDKADWNGDWKVVSKAYPSGWAAEIAIPFQTLGERNPTGESWTVDFIRTRRNVTNEQSRWAYIGRGKAPDTGVLSFAAQ